MIVVHTYLIVLKLRNNFAVAAFVPYSSAMFHSPELPPEAVPKDLEPLRQIAAVFQHVAEELCVLAERDKLLYTAAACTTFGTLTVLRQLEAAAPRRRRTSIPGQRQ